MLCTLTDNTTSCTNQGARHKISFNKTAGLSAPKFSIELTFVGACRLIPCLDALVANFFKDKHQPGIVCGLSRLKPRGFLNNKTVVLPVFVQQYCVSSKQWQMAPPFLSITELLILAQHCWGQHVA